MAETTSCDCCDFLCTGQVPLQADLDARDITWPLAEYKKALEALPETLRSDLSQAWGAPENDPACEGGHFRFAATKRILLRRS